MNDVRQGQNHTQTVHRAAFAAVALLGRTAHARCVEMARARTLTARRVLRAHRGLLGREAHVLGATPALSRRLTAQAVRHAQPVQQAQVAHATSVRLGSSLTTLQPRATIAKLASLGPEASARCAQTVRSQMHPALRARHVSRARQERLGPAACARLGGSRRPTETLASRVGRGRREHRARAVFVRLAGVHLTTLSAATFVLSEQQEVTGHACSALTASRPTTHWSQRCAWDALLGPQGQVGRVLSVALRGSQTTPAQHARLAAAGGTVQTACCAKPVPTPWTTAVWRTAGTRRIWCSVGHVQTGPSRMLSTPDVRRVLSALLACVVCVSRVWTRWWTV